MRSMPSWLWMDSLALHVSHSGAVVAPGGEEGRAQHSAQGLRPQTSTVHRYNLCTVLSWSAVEYSSSTRRTSIWITPFRKVAVHLLAGVSLLSSS